MKPKRSEEKLKIDLLSETSDRICFLAFSDVMNPLATFIMSPAPDRKNATMAPDGLFEKFPDPPAGYAIIASVSERKTIPLTALGPLPEPPNPSL
jgi:hypothetical protein